MHNGASLVAKNAGVTVLLDGQGGDEILAGYEQYFAPYLATYQKNNSDIAQEERAIRNRYPLALSTRDQRWKNHLPRGAKKFLSRAFWQGIQRILALDAASPLKCEKTRGTPPDDLHGTSKGCVQRFSDNTPSLRRPQFYGAFP